jgi:predicted CoA-binding protein
MENSMQSIPDAVLATLKKKDLSSRIAVVGASTDTSKYGFIITQNLAHRGYQVLPVNPRAPEVAGVVAYPDLASVPRPVDIVDFVTPPAVTLQVLKRLDPATVGAVWFQDGSFDDAVLAEAARFPLKVHHACIMVVAGWV